jgi:excisionase family DNA binding protein
MMYSIKIAAERVGLSERTIRRALERRELGHVKLGRAVRIPAEELEDWLRRHFRPVLEIVDVGGHIEVVDQARAQGDDAQHRRG